MSTDDLTEPMRRALAIAERNDGVVFAGFNTPSGGGRVLVSASTVRALADRGLVSLRISPDGGMMGVLRAADAALDLPA